MLSIRILAAGAVLVIAVGSAAAQTATAGPPGKPLPLLQIVQQPNNAKTRAHAKTAAKFVTKTSAKTHRAVAAGRSRRVPTRTATAAAAASIWPAAETATPADIAAFAPAPAPAPQPASASVEPEPSEFVVGGQTVQVASPDDVNALDLAADDQDAAAKTATPSDVTEPEPAAQAMVAMPAPQDASPIGSASWIAQVLAALGGAIAAGSVAWFLIGSAPQRTYG